MWEFYFDVWKNIVSGVEEEVHAGTFQSCFVRLAGL